MSRVLLITPDVKKAKKISAIYQSVSVPCEVATNFDMGYDRIVADPPALVVAQAPETIDPLLTLQTVLKKNAPVTPFIVINEKISMEAALQFLSLGAFDCISTPSTPYEILSVSKRATSKLGRALIASKLIPPKKNLLRIVLTVFLSITFLISLMVLRSGRPSKLLFLGSANLAGTYWDNRDLWVSDWYESTVASLCITKRLASIAP